MRTFFSFQRWRVCLLVGTLGAVASVLLWQHQNRSLRSVVQQRFELRSSQVSDLVQQRMQSVSDVIYGLGNLFILKPHLSRAEFERAVQQIQASHLPAGVSNFHFTRFVPPEQLSAFEASARSNAHADGSLPSNFAVHSLPPPSANQQQDKDWGYYVIDYIWPLEGNQHLAGLEIHTQPDNLEAMLHARHSGALTVSAPFGFYQTPQLDAGVVVRLPAWNKEGQFLGTVGASIHLSKLMQGLARGGYLSGINLRVIDQGWIEDKSENSNNSDNLDNSDNLVMEHIEAPESQEIRNPQATPALYLGLHREQQIQLAGRNWLISVRPSNDFLPSAERRQPQMVLIGGLTGSFFLMLLTLMWQRRQKQNALRQDLLQQRREQQLLEQSEERLRSVLDHIPMGITLVKSGQILFRNAQQIQICGYDSNDTNELDEWWKLVIPNKERARITQQKWLTSYRHARDSNQGSIPPLVFMLTNKTGRECTVQLSGKRIEGGGHVTVLEDITQRQAAEEQIRRLAYFDTLTGLPNRRMLLDRLEQALEQTQHSGNWGAVLLFDLDHFKLINDAHGPEQGDRVLQAISALLLSSLEPEESLARLGGDEFALLLSDLGNDAAQAACRAEAVAERIFKALRSKPITLEDGSQHHVNLSMGLDLFQGTQVAPDTLLQHSDIAMYQAKEEGRNSLRFYDPQMQQRVSERAELESDLRQGIKTGQFALYFQPQVGGQKIVGAEVLLRWKHPEKGFISPAQFIPLAEETGLILPLGQWVLEQACITLAQWQQSEIAQLRDLTLAVNVSPRQFHEEDFVHKVLSALAQAKAPAKRLKLELTEGMLLHDIEGTIDKMMQLRAHGIGFSLDDFGTGYSSLAYLKSLPLQELKIDQSFIRDILVNPNDASIARTIVSLGSSLKLHVTAEGVETEEVRQFLESHGCPSWQGYLLSPPVPLAAFEKLAKEQQDSTGETGSI